MRKYAFSFSVTTLKPIQLILKIKHSVNAWTKRSVLSKEYISQKATQFLFRNT